MLDKIKEVIDEINGFNDTSLDEFEAFRVKHLLNKRTIAPLFVGF